MKTMKNFKRRAIALLLAVLMCLSMMNLTVFAEETDAAEETNEEVYICGLEEHTHNDECYKKQIVKDLVCENEDEGHEHTDECYAPVLDCGLEEGEGAHTHTDDCFEIVPKTTDKQVLTCELAESDPVEASEGHKHGDDCYTVTETRELTCELAESEATEDTEGHTHGEDCYTVTETRELACELAESDPVEAKEGHTHGEDCYVTVPETVDEKVLKCELEESEGHEHTEDCYKTEDVLACELVEHTHTAACYAVVKEFIDKVNELPETLPEEMSQDEYDALKANMEALLALYGEVQDLEVPGWDEYEPFMTAYMKVGGLWEAIEGVTPETMEEVTVNNLSDLKAQCSYDESSKVYKLNDTVTKVNVSATITISDNFTLDLNGKTVAYTGAAGSVFKVSQHGVFTLDDSSNQTASYSYTTNGVTATVDADMGNITNGKGSPEVHSGHAYGNCGGAVYVCSGSTFSATDAGQFIMKGGTLYNNTANTGGAIYIDNVKSGNVCSRGVFEMTGGAIIGNTAKSHEGGGVFNYGSAEISPTNGNIKIVGNTTETRSDLGGGGLYVNTDGVMTIQNAIITENTADGLGGGVASCTKGEMVLLQGAIFGNTGKSGIPENTVYWWGKDKNKTAVDNADVWKDNPTIRAAAQDIMSAGTIGTDGHPNAGTAIQDVRLDGQAHNWAGYAVVKKGETATPVSAVNGSAIYGGYFLGLTAENTPLGSFGGNTVTISGNHSNLHGGGIGCNGVLTLGTATTVEAKQLEGSLPLSISKTLTGADLSKNSFTFELVRNENDENPLSSAQTDTNGNATLSYAAGIDADALVSGGTSIFYVREKQDSNVKENKTLYKVEVAAGNPKIESHAVAGVTFITYRYTPTATISKVKNADGSSATGNVTGTIPFTNEWKTGSLTLSKDLAENASGDTATKFKFKVTLTDPKSYGLNLNQTFGSIQFNNGVAEVEVSKNEPVTLTGIPYGTHYVVEEVYLGSDWKDPGKCTGDINSSTPSLTATITNERNVANLSVTKMVTWNKDKSQDPENLNDQTFTIEVKLGDKNDVVAQGIYADDPIKGGAGYLEDGIYVITLKAGETATITGIPTGTKYTVVETNKDGMAEGYTYKSGEVTENDNKTIPVDGASETIENHYYKSQTTSVTVNKTWLGFGNVTLVDDLIPSEITVKIFRKTGNEIDGNFEKTVTLNRDNKWSTTVDNLLMRKSEDSEPYTYYVEEQGITYKDTEANKLVEYLNKQNATTGIAYSEVVKKDDCFVVYGKGKTANNTQEVLGIFRALVKDNSEISNTWTPATELGNCSFTIKKVDAENGAALSGATFELTHPNGVIEGAKTKENGEVSFNFLRSGVYKLKEVQAPTGHVINGTEWTITIEKDELKSVTSDGDKYTNDWSLKISADGMEDSVLTVKNDRIKGNISITKAIADGDWVNKADFANKEFKFTITGPSYPDGHEVTVKGEGTETLRDLDYGEYTITEAETEVDKYTWKGVDFGDGQNSIKVIVTKNGKLYEVTATNTYTRDLGDLTIDKTVVNNTPLAADEVFKFEVTLTPVAGETLPSTLKDSDGNEYKVVDGKFTVTISGIELNSEYKGNKSVTIKGIPTGTKYAVTEVDAGKWIVTSENGEGTIVSAGSKAEITNTYRPQVNTTRLSVKKVWKGDGDIERPASVTVQLYRNGQASTRNDAVQTLSASNNWSYTWTGLNENYSWSVDEVDVPEGYTREVTESGTRFTITNTYTEPEIPEDPTPLTSLLSVSKVWVGDAGENRPASVSVQFYKDGERAETVTLNDANGWSWSRVLSKEELASKWTVSEVEVPAGYTSVVTTGEDGISFTVTNTFTTTPETPDEPETPDIPDEETPKTDTPDEPVDVPDEQPPLAEIPDEQPPLVDWPPLAEIPEEQPPLVEVPEEIPLIPAEPEVVVPEEPVPMVGIPQTGDFSMVWYAVAILSALGLVVLALKKREDSKD